MLPLATSFLTTTNNLGETALLLATRFGNTKNYLFSGRTRDSELLNQIVLKDLFYRYDKVTILHVAIHRENFGIGFVSEKVGAWADDGDGGCVVGVLEIRKKEEGIGNQSIECDHLNEIGLMVKFVEFISFTFE
ncbi:hypothetical protein Tco_0414074 [Tanacetum coccineum]